MCAGSSIHFRHRNGWSCEFTKYKGNIRKTWDTLKDILNKKKGKSTFPAYFLSENEHVSGAQNIANKFNEYFTNIGPDLARSINTANKAPFDSYLNTPCSNSFLFQYTNPTDIAKIIGQLKPKSSSGYDNISSKLLKEITDGVSCPLSKIINQSLCTGIFPVNLNLQRSYHFTKKTMRNNLAITAQFRCCHRYRKYSKGLLLTSFTTIFPSTVYFSTASTAFVNIIRQRWLPLNLLIESDTK